MAAWNTVSSWRDVIISIEDGNILRFLVCKDIFLCRNILRIILVDIQMIRRQIGDDGNMGASGHGHELEGASIASSPSRTIAGLNAFPEKVILIAGGKDKGIS